MSSGIGGAGGPSGPGGPGGPSGPGPVDPADRAEDAGASDAAGQASATEGSGSIDTDAIAQLAADLDAGRITPEQAMAKLVDDSVAGLPPAEQAELRGMMEEMIANDPYLSGLLGTGGR
jgi:hypothetical protein